MKLSGFSFESSAPFPFPSECLLLLLGNSHLHWGWLPPAPHGDADLICWDTPHLVTALNTLEGRVRCSTLWPTSNGLDPLPLDSFLTATLPLFYASVVPEQTALVRGYPRSQSMTLANIPLPQMYPSLGVDRALGLWAAGQLLGWPAIVVDGGTALTLTAGDGVGQFAGGAILPGLGLQLHSLFKHTAALPLLSLQSLPPRWAHNTPDAIVSGIAYTLLAGVEGFIQDWVQGYAQSQLCFTGGDGQWLYQNLLPRLPPGFDPQRVSYYPHLNLWGMLLLRGV